ncbi:MAG: hypothetical protein JOZ36_17215 [Acidobacteria bacterium]|nr:hypothetical protein [Acidobacteriota bacterium]
MSLSIQPYRTEDESAVNEFNYRLEKRGAAPDLVFYRRALPPWLPPGQNRGLYNEYFIARDGDQVHGGYALKHQDFKFPDGTVRNVGFYHHALSEGIVDKRYALLGSLLLRDALARSSALYCLGMGGYQRALPQMLIRLAWKHCLLPFYFKVLHAAKFLREMQAIRSSRGRRLLMDLAAYSGAGWTALKIYDFFSHLSIPPGKRYQVDEVSEFSDWADHLWQSSKAAYSLTAVRDGQVLRTLYPAEDHHLRRLRVSRQGGDIGWAVVGERRRDPKYGSLRVGSILDCWADPADAVWVIEAASFALRDQGFDLVVSNQSHQAWARAFEACGFMSAPSNFIFAASKKLSEWIAPFEKTLPSMHVTRADGDGLPRNF